MREMIMAELTRALQEMIRSAAHLLPSLIVMLVFVIIGWLVAYVVKWLLHNILVLVKFDKVSENAGASQFLSHSSLPTPTELVSRFVFWVAWLGFILLGVNFLGIGGLQQHVSKFFLFLPRLFVALFIVFFGMLLASFFSRAALLAAVNKNFGSPRLLSISIRTITVIFVFSMVFEELGLAQETMLVAFGIVFGAAMLGFAIAFGLGGKDLARQFLERRFTPEKDNEKEEEPSPL